MPIPATMNRTLSATTGAEDLGMDDTAVVTLVQGLTLQDFEKSMTSMADHKIWQDVYKPTVGGRQLYVKFTLDTQKQLLLISFKEA